jgi:hypothetical protein
VLCHFLMVTVTSVYQPTCSRHSVIILEHIHIKGWTGREESISTPIGPGMVVM